MNKDVLDHIESRVAHIKSLFVSAATRIERLHPGEKIPATQLSEEIAKELRTNSNDKGPTGAVLYPTLKILFDNYPGVEIKRGAHGGIMRPLPKTVSTEETKS